MGLTEQAQEFFVYTTLGIVPERMYSNAYKEHFDNLLNDCKDFDSEATDYKWYCAFMCAKAAYNDLCRTLEYKNEFKTSGKKKKVKETAINSICINLVQAIFKDGQTISDSKKLFSVFFNDNELNDQNFTDKGLKKYLKKYKSKDKKHENEQEFHFGQAQKWVNMTLKYLYLLGIVKNPDDLHIPIDNYVLAALNDKYNISSNTVWSQFNYDNYDELYTSYNKVIKPPYINWEHDAWIIQAEKEKGINEK